MGDWRKIGDELVDSFLTGEDEDMKELGELIQDRLGCYNCEAKDLCDNYKDDVFDGECYKVLNSFFADTEDEDTEDERKRREEEARIQREEDWRSWTYRD